VLAAVCVLVGDAPVDTVAVGEGVDDAVAVGVA